MTNVTLSPKLFEVLDFGTPSAERDIGRGLEECFVESAAYQRVRSGAKTIVMGNRGAGKSAIFKMLAKRERAAGSQVIELSPEDYSYELLSSTMAAENAGSWAKHGAYGAAWKYLIYILIMKALARKGMRLTKGGGRDIHHYIRDHHANSQLGTLSLLISYLKRLEGIKIGPVAAGLRAQELDKLYKLEEIHNLLPALRKVLDGQRVVVLVDELDRGWDSSEDAKAFVSGLFQACVSINEQHPNLRVYVSLRQELYDDIPALYEDAQKHRDLLERIHWSEESLLELIAKRIRYSAHEKGFDVEALERAGDAGCWSSVFAGPPADPLAGSFRYMVDRTLYRPREIIQFCSEALEQARGRSRTLPVPHTAIERAEYGYSSERAKDIAAEYRFQYPGLLGVFEVFRGRPCTFSRDSLELLCLELATGEIPTSGTESWLTTCEPNELIGILWQAGLLSAQPSGDDCYFGKHQVQHLNLAAVQRFQIHPMFRAHLGIGDKIESIIA
ncbi:P-loop ATPase, Sll1717 family [Spirillospora sp. NPDC048911]|uniref:P-loop ATPase, Sll1717 family n=1 Tax=Spirillospora sp. NPDC048911 TaxID=3364527 RepID=UPI00371172C7